MIAKWRSCKRELFVKKEHYNFTYHFLNVAGSFIGVSKK